ncbi:uncharacterized protein lrriq3 [Salminus brasiliensis]|uniref:uncharacterized protein lrriq3 n=1 Tax=Salminus brasiliensis TaxID=930266 RepID=UPI003B830C84
MEALIAQKAFLVNCSESLILDHGRSTLPEDEASNLQDILLVRLSGLLLKNLDQLGSCKALKICILADNFLTRIDPLAECVHLVKLDLKGNQISHLPSASFWSNLKDLRLLNLHDNNIADRSSISALSGCLRLTALTLYDTPLSLKRNYRHCVVNSIWSLKALDNHVISDEEIVESWHLPPKFKTMASSFCVNLYPSSKSKLEERNSAVKRLFMNLSKLEQVDRPEMVQEEMSVRSLDSKMLKDLRMPCNTPESNIMKPGDSKLSLVGVDDVHDEVMDREAFHLLGFKATVHSSEPYTHMLISRKALGQEVRDAIGRLHSQKPVRPYCPQQRPPKISSEKRFSGRCHDCFTLVPFQTIERAYWAKKKAEDLKEKMEQVVELQGRRDSARGHRESFMEARRRDALLQQDQDKAELEEMLSLQRAKNEKEVQLARQKHLSFLEGKRRRRSEHEMVINFSGQHRSLAKVITKQCNQQRLSNAQHEKRRQVATSKHEAEAQKLLIYQYLENRRQNIHAEAVASRASGHTVISEKQHHELLAAQARVAHIKSSHYRVEVLRPEPRSQPA